MQETTIDYKTIKRIIRRRWKTFAAAFSLLIFIGCAIAFIPPSIYRSKSTILIEGQQIPPEYVMTTITSYVEERLQTITQRIMSRSRLLEIINRFDLYKEMREHYTTEEIVEEMRDDIKFDTISAEVIDKRTGRPTAATIAFTLSYEGKNPATVQKVANVLASLYLEENLKTREQSASDTAAFFQQEINNLKAEIDGYQSKISHFKNIHLNELPEYSALNLQNLAALNRNFDQIADQLNTLKDRKILLEGQLSNVDPLTPILTAEGKTVMNPTERLKYLRLDLIGKQSLLSVKHPDIKRLKKEIAELEAQVDIKDDSVEKIKKLEDLETKLALMQSKLGSKHPDVINLSKEVKALSAEVISHPEEIAKIDIQEEKPDNPAYINIKTQIISSEAEIRNIKEQQKELKEKIADYEKRLAQAPLVEKEYMALMSDYENAKRKYTELMNKYMEAKVAQGMEESQRGERFTIVDPAQYPEKPYKPNRVAILLISLFMSFGAGFGLLALLEAFDTSVKDIGQLGSITGLPVLAEISMMTSPEELKARRLKSIGAALAIAAVIALGLFLISIFYMPLDILWIKIQRVVNKIMIF
ncbi:GumC family protein [Desulfobacterium sp. N47]|uniref:GumC family protein n=1 Tax=Desulfobacterium sp. N47 TaxID=3115210 RepID=UPI003F4A5D7E